MHKGFKMPVLPALLMCIICTVALLASTSMVWSAPPPPPKATAAPAATPSVLSSGAPPAVPSKAAPDRPGTRKPGTPSSASPTPAAEPSGSADKSPSPGVSGVATPGGSPSASPAASTEASPAEPEGPVIFGIDVKKNIILIASVGGGVLVFLILVVVLLGKKKKYACDRCGKSVLPGMVYCEDCTEQRSGPEKPMTYSPPAKVTREEPRPVRETPPVPDPALKKKIRPSGRVIAVITVRRGANPGYKFNFYETQNQVTLGNDPESDFVIEEDEEVSARHAVITMSEKDGFQVFDMGNTSGLFVNNEKVKQSGLKSGDVIKLGKTELTFARL
jgi:hypothetical protein